MLWMNVCMYMCMLFGAKWYVLYVLSIHTYIALCQPSCLRAPWTAERNCSARYQSDDSLNTHIRKYHITVCAVIQFIRLVKISDTYIHTYSIEYLTPPSEIGKRVGQSVCPTRCYCHSILHKHSMMHTVRTALMCAYKQQISPMLCASIISYVLRFFNTPSWWIPGNSGAECMYVCTVDADSQNAW